MQSQGGFFKHFFLGVVTVFGLIFSPLLLAGSFTSYPTSTDMDGNYSLSWELSGSGTLKRFVVNEYKNNVFTEGVASSGTSVAINGRASGSYRYDLYVTRRFRQGSEWRVVSKVEHSVTVNVSVSLNPPGKPSVPSLSNNGSYSVTWNTVTGATRYELQEKINSGSWNLAQNNSNKTKPYSGKIDGTYYYRVRACNSSLCSSYSAAATARVVRPPSSAPSINSASSKTTYTTMASYTLTWSNVSNATRYEPQRYYNSSWINTPSGLTLSLGNHQFRVRACNDGGCSAWSSTRTVTVSQVPNISGVSPNRQTFTLTVSGKGDYIDVKLGSNAYITKLQSKSFTRTLSPGDYSLTARSCWRDGSSFSCTAYGKAFALKIIGPPGTPASITPTSTQSTSGTYTVNWGAASGTVHKYELYAQKNSGSWSLQYSGNGSSKTFSGLTDGDYRYQVRACNTINNIEKCSGYRTSNGVKVRHKPSTPGAANPTTSTDTGHVLVSWSTVSRATYYNLQRRNNAGSWGSTQYRIGSTSYTINNLTDGSWDFRVQACNGYDWACSAFGVDGSSVVWRKVPSTPAAPTVPTKDIDGSYTVSWNKPSGTVSYYWLQERKNNTGDWTTVTSRTGAISHPVSGRTDGAYDYRVRACNGFDWACSSYSAVSSDVSVLHVPGVPTALAVPAQDADGQVILSWGSSSGQVSRYELEEYDSGWKNVYSDAHRSVELTHSDGTYQYRVRACNASGCSGYKTGSNALIVAVRPPVPNAPSSPSTSTGSADISWNATARATYYDIQKRLDSGSWQSAKAGDTNTSETLTGLTDGSWTFRVRACNRYSWSCSNDSAVSTATLVRLIPAIPVKPTTSITQSTSGSYSVNWAKPSGTVTFYDVRERKNSGSWTVMADDTSALSVSRNLPSGDYDYQVRACNGYDWACTPYSAASVKAKVRYVPTAPAITKPTYSIDSNGDFTLQWNTSTPATYYRLQKRTNGGSWTMLADNLSAVSYSENDTGSGIFEYRVSSCHEFVWACSNFGSVKTIQVAVAPDFAVHDEILVDDVPLVTPSIPANENVGALAGAGGVSGGSATYVIPIALAPGRAGMQPNVSLNYSSRGGNGIAGVGWQLSAGASIHRCSATQAQDGFTAAPQYDASRDRLCLNGQRLINVGGVYGQSGTEYRTELDTFAKVVQTGAINSASTSFTVYHKNGRISDYGTTADSRHSAHGRSEILSWAIAKVSDRSGNFMQYRYDYHGDNDGAGKGEYTLTSIEYTGDSENEPDRKVVLEYADRKDSQGKTDYQSSYLAGGLTRKTQRLKNIRTYYDGQIIRDYYLDYGNLSISSGRTLLRSVRECAYKNFVAQCLPATQFDWQEAKTKYVLEPVEFNQGSSTIAANVADKISRAVPKSDIDGDGVRDWPGLDTNNDGEIDVQGIMANAEREVTDTHSEQTEGCVARASLGFGTRCLTADFNQDGKTDFFKTTGSTSGEIKIRYNGSTEWVSSNVSLEHYQDDILSFSDFNGDGWPDITVKQTISDYAEPKIYLYPHTRDITQPYNTNTRLWLFDLNSDPNAAFQNKESVQEVGDMDGNGTPDFVIMMKPQTGKKIGMPYPIKMLLSKSKLNHGIEFTEVAFTGHLQQVDTSSNKGGADFFHDINGDGLPDWLSMNTNEDDNYWLEARLNIGGSFAPDWIDLNVMIPTRLHWLYISNDPGAREAYQLPLVEKNARNGL